MKKNLMLIFLLSINVITLRAQDNNYSAIKLFVDQERIALVNYTLEPTLWGRLYTKTTQLINQTGVAETGYSTFSVVPKFDTLDISLDESGISKLYLAECELNLSIIRVGVNNEGGATFSSLSKKTMGSGSSKEAAIANAINSISSNDNEIVEYLKRSKIRIDEYYKANCNAVLKEAEQASKLQMYAKSIALYFSVPSSAGQCYETARAASIGVYRSFLDGACDSQLIKLKAVVALAMTGNTNRSSELYNEALNIISRMNPISAKCYKEAEMQIQKIEKRFDETQKHDWELETQRAANSTEIQKEMIRAVGKINSNYQPSGGTVIIAR